MELNLGSKIQVIPLSACVEVQWPHALVSALISGSSSLGLSPGWRYCVVFLGKTMYSDIASLHPGVQMGTHEFNAVQGSRNIPSRFII